MISWVVTGVGELPEFAWAAGEELRQAYPLPAAFKAFLPVIQERLGTSAAGEK